MIQDNDKIGNKGDDEIQSEYTFESGLEEEKKQKEPSAYDASKSDSFIMESAEEKAIKKAEAKKEKEPTIFDTNEEIMAAPLVKKRSFFTAFLDLVLNLAIIVGLVLIIRTFIISPFQVFGPSMCDTFNNFFNKCGDSFGEYLIVNKFGYQNFFGWQIGLPGRGDIVIFHPPHNEGEFFIKRIIGLPGETVKLIDGDVYILNDENPKGFILDEPYLNTENNHNTKNDTIPDMTVFEVPEESYLVFGDNRLHSSDSRSCFAETNSTKACEQEGKSPYLTLDHIEGKAWIILWPFNRMSFIEDPVYSS
jgi:signal peptidase I